MSSSIMIARALRASSSKARLFSTSVRYRNQSRQHDRSASWRERQTEKPLNPYMTNTNSTVANDMPSVGKDSAPPELITSVDPSSSPQDSLPENTQRMTGGTQKGGGGPSASTSAGENENENENAELSVGEIEGGSFRVEPLRRSDEDTRTMRARLLYQSRKRGTLESDLLLSTFADAHLGTMSADELREYDSFLDENDWDIYYWATQEPTPTSLAYAEGSGPDLAEPAVQGKDPPSASHTDAWRAGKPRSGEWAQTVGAFKPAYRPVPSRWKDSGILKLLRKHVDNRRAVGDKDGKRKVKKGVDVSARGKGLGMMPEIRSFDA